MKTEQQLLRLKREAEEAKQKISELKGQRIALMKQLLTDYKCNSIEEGEKRLKAMTIEIGKLQESIENGIQTLEEMYNV